MSTREDPTETLEGEVAGSGWRYRTTATTGEIVFVADDGAEQQLTLTGGTIVEVRDLGEDGRGVAVRTERFEHTLHLDPRDEGWRVLMTTGSLPPKQ